MELPTIEHVSSLLIMEEKPTTAALRNGTDNIFGVFWCYFGVQQELMIREITSLISGVNVKKNALLSLPIL